METTIDDPLTPEEVEPGTKKFHLEEPQGFYSVSIQNMDLIGIKKTDSIQKLNGLIILVSFSVIVLSALLRGGKGEKSIVGMPLCSSFTWEVFGLSQALSFLLALFAFGKNIKQIDEQSSDNYTEYKERSLRNRLLFASYYTGLATGAVGVGGPLLLGIYMYSLGMTVSSSSALSAFVIIFSSSSTTIESVIEGSLRPEHSVPILLMSMGGALVGSTILKPQLVKYQKQAFIMKVLQVILGLNCLLLIYQLLIGVSFDPKAAFTFGRFC